MYLYIFIAATYWQLVRIKYQSLATKDKLALIETDV